MPEVDIFSILLVALGLSADCFAVALSGSISMGHVSPRQVMRVSFAFGFFQFLMPVIGWLLGLTVIDLISDYDHWVAFGLLAFVGGRMIMESLREKEEKEKVDISRGITLLTLAFATSIDALAVGLTFALVEVDVVTASSVIGIVAFLITGLGLLVGVRAGRLAGKRAEIIGGVILIAIGVRILISHLF